MTKFDSELDGANQSDDKPEASPRMLSLGAATRFSLASGESGLRGLFSNLKDLLTRSPANSQVDNLKSFAMPRFGASLGDNWKEFLRSSPRGKMNSGLLVEWDGSGEFWQNLRELLLRRTLKGSIGTGSGTTDIPEIWSKNTQFTRVQALSVAFHVVVLVLLILPFLPGVLSPALTTNASSKMNAAEVSLYMPKLAAGKPAGGGGGQPDNAPAIRGQAPKFSFTQIARPMARPVIDPKLAVAPTLLGNPALNPPNITAQNWGDPLSRVLGGDSMGQAPGTGIGPGSGGGLGPGSDNGYGDSIPRGGAGGYGTPACIYCPSPAFTEDAVKAKFQGIVDLIAVITADGRATDIKVAKGLGLGLDEKAIDAVRNWRFKPAMGPNGKPASVQQVIEVTFHLY